MPFCVLFLLSPICLSRRSKEQLPLGLTSMHLYCFALPRVLTLSFFLGTCRIVFSKRLPFLRSGSKKDNCSHVPVILIAVRGSFVIWMIWCCLIIIFTTHKLNQQIMDTFVLLFKIFYWVVCALGGLLPPKKLYQTHFSIITSLEANLSLLNIIVIAPPLLLIKMGVWQSIGHNGHKFLWT